MCGIGFAMSKTAGAGLLMHTVQHLAAKQVHRGPDEEGFWENGKTAAMSHRRLSVIDLKTGQQPMTDGRYTIVFNGELYNYRELRDELLRTTHEFKTDSDTEVVLAAYKAWGGNCFSRFDGMFALVIWDEQEQSALLARDRAGEKPLYYMWHDDMLIVSSEMKPLLSVRNFEPRFSPYGVFEYLAQRYVSAPNTAVQGVMQVEPGTVLTTRCGTGRAQRTRYYWFERRHDIYKTTGDASDEVEHALTGAIERRLISEVPLGAFLSSGVDSPLVCAMIAKKLGRKVHTYSMGFEGAKDDETARAAKISDALDLEHTSIKIDPTSLYEVSTDIGDVLDEPNGDRSCVPTYLLAQAMRKEVTVALSGDAGDELFCGYSRYHGLQGLTKSVHPLDVMEQYFIHRLPVVPMDMLRVSFPREYKQWRERMQEFSWIGRNGSHSDGQLLSEFDFHTYLPGAVLPKVDRMSMKHSLEVRTPFLDPGVMQIASELWAAQLPTSGLQKPVLRKILSKYLPDGMVLDNKVGFGMPGDFFQANEVLMRALLIRAISVLNTVAPFKDRPQLLPALAAMNINAVWAVIALGLWADSVGIKG